MIIRAILVSGSRVDMFARAIKVAIQTKGITKSGMPKIIRMDMENAFMSYLYSICAEHVCKKRGGITNKLQGVLEGA